MKPRLWMPVAVLGLAGGAVVAMIANRTASQDVESQALPQASVDGAIAVDSESASIEVSSAQDEAADGASSYALALQSLSEVDRTLPEFSLPALDDTVWTPDSLKGKPWVINFWATWCPPCIEEIPSMNAAYEVLEPQGIGMLAINAAEGALAVEAFLQKISIEFPNVLGDANTLLNWTVKGLPTTIVVDSEGRVVYEALGPREWDDEALLQQVIDLL